MSRCRSCQAEIVWTVSERGRRMPIDADPYDGDDPRGLFVLRHDPVAGDTPIAVAAPRDAFPHEPHFRSHFTTCPQRDDWRRP